MRIRLKKIALNLFVVTVALALVVPLDVLSDVANRLREEHHDEQRSKSLSSSFRQGSAGPMTSASVTNDVLVTWIPKTRAKRCSPKSRAEVKNDLKSQQREDMELLQIFPGFCNGTYIEMGALNGIRFSNTYM